ncbi:MAG: hypothetical protein AB9834_04230 [Lentimicrobium sp.]
MKLSGNLLDFILFRYSFEIQTEIDPELVRKRIFDRLNGDKSFLYPVFDKNEFAFSHKNFFPEFYNFSPFIFEGEITSKSGTSIIICAKTYPVLIWFFVAGIIIALIGYFTNFIGIKDDLMEPSFPFNPLFSPIFMLLPYGYYFMKINDVKGIIKNIVAGEEKPARQKL